VPPYLVKKALSEIGVAAKAPPAAKTKAKGKGEAPAEGQVQTTPKSDPFAAPHDHGSAFQVGEGGGGGVAQLGAIWFPAGLFEKFTYLENCSIIICF
jgi:hypothetical protein